MPLTEILIAALLYVMLTLAIFGWVWTFCTDKKNFAEKFSHDTWRSKTLHAFGYHLHSHRKSNFRRVLICSAAYSLIIVSLVCLVIYLIK